MDTTIPFTAWEQAVFVGMFAVVIFALLAWFTKQSDKWQNFIARMEEQWRNFNKEQRKENNDCMQGLTDVIHELLLQVKEMRDDDKLFRDEFHAHDAQAKEIKQIVETNGKPASAARAKKTTTTKE